VPAPASFSAPKILSDPGYLWLAPLGTAAPTNTVTGGLFTDVVAAAWIPLGATVEGSTLSYSTSVEAIRVAEFFDPIKYATTERSGSMAFALANWTASNVKRAMNGGVAALTSTGTTGSELTRLTPPAPGSEVRSMVLWESTDATVRVLLYQVLQGGDVSIEFKKAPSFAGIPFTMNMEIPAGSAAPFDIWTAGLTRV
jgi:hypothetical protein